MFIRSNKLIFFLVLILLSSALFAQVPQISFSPDTLKFGSLDLGDGFVLYDTIRNTGTDTLEIWRQSLSGDGLSVISNLYSAHQYIRPGFDLKIAVGFFPKEEKTYFDSLVIATNDPADPSVTVYISGLGIGRTIFLHETIHDFGEVIVSDTASGFLWVENTGNEVLSVDSIVTSSSFFRIDSTSFGVDSAAFQGIPVYFLPDSERYYEAEFLIYSNATNDSIKEYTVRGTGVAPHIILTDSVLNFGSVNVFDTLSVKIPVVNTGTYPLTVSAYSLNDPAIFKIADSTEIIYQGDTSSLFITFDPESLKTYTDTLTVASNAFEGTKKIVLSGAGGLPQISVSADSINFSDVTIMSDSYYRLVITNTNSGILNITSISSDSSVYSFGTYKSSIAGGDTSLVYVKFTPQDFSYYPDTITIACNDTSNSTIKIPLNGRGVGSSISFTRVTFDFDTIQIGLDTTLSFYIKNTGNQDLIISGINSAAGYTSDITANYTIVSDDSSLFNITFGPDDKGLYQSELIIQSNDLLSPADTLTLSGYCLEPEILLGQTEISFQNLSTGNSDSVFLNIINTGNDSLRLTFQILNSAIFTSAYSNLTIAPADTDSVKLVFTPTRDIGFFDTLKITSNTYLDTINYIELTGNPDSNFLPLFTNMPDTTADEDVLYSVTLIVNNRDNDALVFRVLTGPAAFSIDSLLGTVGWTPGQPDTGYNSVSIEVDDGKGGKDTLNYTLFVQEYNDLPVFSSIPPDTAYRGIQYVYSPVVTDEEGDALTFVLEAFPSGMTIGSSSGIISWVPQNLGIDNLVVVKAADSRGGITRQTFYIDVVNRNFPPVFTSAPDTSAFEDAQYSYTFTASDTNGDNLYFNILSAPEGASIGSETGVLTWTPDNRFLGNNYFQIGVSDVFDASDTIDFYLNVINVNDPPSLEDSYNYTGYVDSLFSIVISGQDIDPADTLFYFDNSALFDIDSVSGAISFTPAESDTGTYQVKIWVSDRDGADTADFNLNIRFLNFAPVLTSIPDTTIYEASQFIYNVEADDPDTSGFLKYYDNTGMFDIDSLTGEIDYSPSDADVGTHLIEIRVFDGYNYDIDTFQISVLNINQAPQVVSINDTTIYEDQAFVYTVSASDPDQSDTLFFSDNTDLFDIDINTGTIDFTPVRADSGLYSIKIYVFDGEYYDTAGFNITVQLVNKAPEFTSIPDTVAIKGKVYSYNAEAVDIDGDTVYYYLVTAPAGMSADSVSGQISWTPGFGQVGSHSVKIKADDKNAGISYQEFVIIVLDANYPPVIFSTPDTTAVEDEAYAYYIIAEDPEGSSLNFVLEKAPEGMTINPDSAAIFWTPANKNTGLNQIKLIVYDAAGDSAVQEFNIFVENVNDPPLWTALPDSSVAANSVLYISIYNYIEDPDDNFTDLSFTFLNSVHLEGIYMDSLLLIYASGPDFEGIDSLSIIAADPGGLSDTVFIKITVFKPSGAPVFLNDTIHVEFPEDKNKVIGYRDWVTDADTPLDELDLSFTASENVNIVISDSANKLLNFTPAVNWFGGDTVTVVVTDPDQNRDTALVVISVLPVEDVPLITFFTPPGDTTLSENGTILFSCSAIDGDGDQLIFSWYENGISVSGDTFYSFTAVIDTTNERAIILNVTDGQNIVQKTWNIVISPQTGIDEETAIPEKFKVFHNYPNPFNLHTKIKVQIPERGDLSIVIFNALGQRIRTIYRNSINAGTHTFTWDSRNGAGETVSSGVYFYAVTWQDEYVTGKMILLK
ncbi:putative Ig domain-containing protein [candidate division KSB1 bacterium]